MSTKITTVNPYVNPYAFVAVHERKGYFVDHLMGIGDLHKLGRKKRK